MGMFDGGTITDIGGPDSKYDENGNPVSWNPETESYTTPDVIDWSKYMGSETAAGGLPPNWKWYLLIAAGVMLIIYFILKK